MYLFIMMPMIYNKSNKRSDDLSRGVASDDLREAVGLVCRDRVAGNSSGSAVVP
jgi:hypothetical protein